MSSSQTVDVSAAPVEQTQEVPVASPGSTPPKGFLRRHRWWIIAAAVAVLAAGGGIGAWLATSGSPAAGFHVTTDVVSVTTGAMKQTVAASGTIAPAQEADLNFAVSGKVVAVNVAAGQAVTAGQTLASVAPTALQADTSAAQASLTAAQAKLSSDQADGASTSQIDSDQASVTSARDQLTTAQKDLADANLTSTISGTVASVDLTTGQEVSGSGGSGSSAPSGGSGGSGGSTSSSGTGASGSSGQVVVISTGSYVVNTTVDDTEVGEVAAGDQAVITPTGSTTPVYGTVASVGMIASGSSSVASFPVAIDVTGSPSGIYAGSSAEVSIVVKQLNDVIEVPTAAISYTSSQAAVTLVKSGGQHVSEPVTVGTNSDGETQITQGLSAGQKVLERVVTFTGAPGGTGTARNIFGGRGAPSGGFPGGGSFVRSGGTGGAEFTPAGGFTGGGTGG